METEAEDGREMTRQGTGKEDREGGPRGVGRYSQVSMSAEANFPVAPKWILMNFPWGQMGQRVRELA